MNKKNQQTRFHGKRKSGFDEKLTASEAQHILKAEGGEITLRELIIQVVWTLAISAALAWAIIKGNATAWHLGLPMVAEYLACVLLIPILNLFYRHAELRKETMKCLILIVILLMIGLSALTVDARAKGNDIVSHFNLWMAKITDFVIGKEVHWAILIAAFHSARGLWRNVIFLMKNGPPFLGPGMGCGMRVAVLVLALIIVPAFAMFGLGILQDVGVRWKPSAEWIKPVWLIWGLYVIAELLTLWFLWDIQSKLKAEGVDTSKL
jgi:hypothetical protein